MNQNPEEHDLPADVAVVGRGSCFSSPAVIPYEERGQACNRTKTMFKGKFARAIEIRKDVSIREGIRESWR